MSKMNLTSAMAAMAVIHLSGLGTAMTAIPRSSLVKRETKPEFNEEELAELRSLPKKERQAMVNRLRVRGGESK